MSSSDAHDDRIPIDDPELVEAFRRQIASECTRLEVALSAREVTPAEETNGRIHAVAHRLRSSTAYLGLDDLVRSASDALEVCESGGDAVVPATSLIAGIREYLASIDA